MIAATKTAAIARSLKILIRLSGAAALVLGLTVWAGYLRSWMPLHVWLGVALVLAMWATAALAFRASTRRGLAVVVLLWGLGIIVLGHLQDRFLPGASHWIISLTHLLAGGLGIAIGAALASAIQRSSPGGSVWHG